MKHLKIGDLVPSWSGKNETGETLSFKDFIGKKTAIYFYPKDNTPGCTNQACNIRDSYSILLGEGIYIIGVSADSEKIHQKFIEKQNLPFPLIADEDKSMIKTFGVWGEKKFMGRTYDGIHRTTFLIDEKNKIIDIIEKPKTTAHAQEILESFKKNS
jgi:peroxiredoxin Q/BCP